MTDLEKVLDAFAQFSRNERWGTCADCPKDRFGHAYPEFCKNTNRYDHHLLLGSLADLYRLVRREMIT